MLNSKDNNSAFQSTVITSQSYTSRYLPKVSKPLQLSPFFHAKASNLNVFMKNMKRGRKGREKNKS